MHDFNVVPAVAIQLLAKEDDFLAVSWSVPCLAWRYARRFQGRSVTRALTFILTSPTAGPLCKRHRVGAVKARAVQTEAPPPIKVPKSIHDVDNGKILGFGADLSEDHPVS